MEDLNSTKKGKGFHGKGKASRSWREQVFSDLAKFNYLFLTRNNEIPVLQKEQNT